MTRGTYTFLGIIILIVVLLGINIFVPKAVSTTSSMGTTTPNPERLPGLMASTAPWPNNVATLGQRLDVLQLPKLTAEGTVLHIHQHVDIFVHGQTVAVPADIGIPQPETYISVIHTHDGSGVVHVESPVQAQFTLGQFFDIWGLKFTTECIGAYCTDATNSLRVYVNGELHEGDPRQIVLKEHDEYAIVYGTSAEAPKTIPRSFNFPAGD